MENRSGVAAILRKYSTINDLRRKLTVDFVAGGSIFGVMPKLPTTPHNKTTLLAIATELGEAQRALDVVAKSLEVHGIEQLEVTHNYQAITGMEAISDFATATKKALRQALAGKGHFQAGPTQGKEVPAAKPKKK